MDTLIEIVNSVFAYCTNFILNLTEILSVSYYEVNAVLFVILWPILTIALIVLNIYQRAVLFKFLKKNKHIKVTKQELINK
jgi:hypothetical protein